MIAIITAAGNGTRMQYSIPKQFIRVNGIPIYIYTIRKFINLVDKICLVIPIGYSVKIINELIEFNLPKAKIDLCIGGNSADESRRLGLTYMYNKYKPKYVIFHDAVRPGVSISLIKSVINTVKKVKMQ